MRPFKILGVQQIAVGGEDKKNSKLFGWISSDLKKRERLKVKEKT